MIMCNDLWLTPTRAFELELEGTIQLLHSNVHVDNIDIGHLVNKVTYMANDDLKLLRSLVLKLGNMIRRNGNTLYYYDLEVSEMNIEAIITQYHISESVIVAVD